MYFRVETISRDIVSCGCRMTRDISTFPVANQYRPSSVSLSIHKIPSRLKGGLQSSSRGCCDHHIVLPKWIFNRNALAVMLIFESVFPHPSQEIIIFQNKIADLFSLLLNRFIFKRNFKSESFLCEGKHFRLVSPRLMRLDALYLMAIGGGWPLKWNSGRRWSMLDVRWSMDVVLRAIGRSLGMDQSGFVVASYQRTLQMTSLAQCIKLSTRRAHKPTWEKVPRSLRVSEWTCLNWLAAGVTNGKTFQKIATS